MLLTAPFLLTFSCPSSSWDIGKCANLNPGLVDRVARSFPDLDSAGCGVFEIRNVSFVLLNTVALLCGNNELLSDVETVIERESAYLRRRIGGKENTVQSNETNKDLDDFRWRLHSSSSQSGPVLLVHFPLRQIPKSYCRQRSSFNTLYPDSLKLPYNRLHADSGPYDLLHAVPPNATDYIFRALKPRMIFSAHNDEFCDFSHPDGTREVSVPSLAWAAKNDPGLAVATFKRNGVVNVMHCSLPSESYVIAACVTIFALSISIAVITYSKQLRNVRQNI